MNLIKRLLLLTAIAAPSTLAFAQYNNSGISAGFFDSSENSTINFSEFHLPPLGVLYENAKENPTILSLAKAQEIAQAEVAKQKRHIFSYVYGHASYSYGKGDMWGNSQNNSSTINTIYQYQGTEQSYWNVGVNISVPLEDILDLGAAVKRKKLLVDQAEIQKEIAYNDLKQRIAALYIQITNDLVALKTASENAAIYQGAGALNLEDFHQGNMSIEDFAYVKLRESSAVTTYQNLQTTITTNIITLELLTRTPIITNTTTEITLEGNRGAKTERQIARERRAQAKKIKRELEEEERRIRQLEREEREAQIRAEREAKKKKK